MPAPACSLSAFARWTSCIAVTAAVFAATAGSPEETTPAALPLKTFFADEHARLSDAELDQVVSLAKECGLRDVALVQTFYVLPSSVGRICVTSGKQTLERNTTYECVYMSRIGWHKGDAPPKAKRVGLFWVAKPYKSPVLLRAYQIGEKSIQIQLCDRIRPAFADLVLAQIVSHKVQFKSEECRSAFSALDLSQTESLSKDDDGSYRLDLASNTIVRFKAAKGKVVVTGVEEYII